MGGRVAMILGGVAAVAVAVAAFAVLSGDDDDGNKDVAVSTTLASDGGSDGGSDGDDGPPDGDADDRLARAIADPCGTLPQAELEAVLGRATGGPSPEPDGAEGVCAYGLADDTGEVGRNSPGFVDVEFGISIDPSEGLSVEGPWTEAYYLGGDRIGSLRVRDGDLTFSVFGHIDGAGLTQELAAPIAELVLATLD